MNVRLKEAELVKANPAFDADVRILRLDEYCGPEVKAEDIHLRSMLLCHDQYDRTYERFPKAYLERFCETLPGKSTLACHDTGGWLGGGQLPLGRFYKAELDQRTENEFPVLTHGRRTAEAEDEEDGKGQPIPGFEAKRKKVEWLKADWYFPNHESTEGLRSNIDLGVYKWVSIGFSYDDVICDVCGTSYIRSSCPHIRGTTLDDGRIVTLTYGGDAQKAEAREGSIVYLGAQQRARLSKQLESGSIDPKALAQTPYGEDLVLLKEAEDLARQYGHDKKIFAVGDGLGSGTLAQQLDSALGAVKSITGRFADLVDKREEQGDRINPERVQEMVQIRTEMDTLIERAKALDAKEQSGIPDELRFRAAKLRAASLRG